MEIMYRSELAFKHDLFSHKHSTVFLLLPLVWHGTLAQFERFTLPPLTLPPIIAPGAPGKDALKKTIVN